MKIVHVIPSLACGGAEILMGNIAIEQANSGNDVKIVVLEEFDSENSNFPLMKELLSKFEIKVIEVNISYSIKNKQMVLNNNLFSDFIEAFQPNVIHSHLFRAEVVSRNKIVKNIKYFTHCHNNMSQFNFFEKKSFRRKLTDFLEVNWLIKQYKLCNNQFITISKDTELYYQKQLPKSLRPNIFILNNAINTSLFFSNKEKVSSKSIKLISVGSLLLNKGHFFLINVVNDLVLEGYNVRLTIVGDGPEMNNLLKIVSNYGLDEHVFFSGVVNNVQNYLADSDIYVHAAFKEAFGLALIEAMASELPVVSTNGGGNKDILIEGYNGYLINDRSRNQFLDKIKQLIKDEELRSNLGMNALNFSKQFDIKNYVKKLNEFYLR